MIGKIVDNASAPAADMQQIIKAQDPNVLVLVDNCYGEFTEEQEPTAVGAGEIKGLYGCRNPHISRTT
jgi:cystathionine beta-lyase family protein involved in aluminum resistance